MPNPTPPPHPLKSWLDRQGMDVASFVRLMKAHRHFVSRQTVDYWLDAETCPNLRNAAAIERITASHEESGDDSVSMQGLANWYIPGSVPVPADEADEAA